MKKRIKIFAAFDKDTEEDVVRFGDFLCGLNAHCSSVEFSVFKNEKELCESLERSKEQIDGELETCEYFLLILGGTSDEFALDKLNRAIERYAKTRGNPDIHIFVNTANKGADEVIKFFASEKYEHYVEQFKHNDTLKAKFLIWLSAKQKDFIYETDTDIHGTPVIKVGGNPVSSLVDFDALLNNDDYQHDKKKLIKKREQREKYRAEALKAGGEERNDLWDEISALAKEIDELQDGIAARERDTLALYQNYAKMTLESGYNAKLKRARECIEQGDLDRAREVLDPEGTKNDLKAIRNEHKVLSARIETHKIIAEQKINILFAEIGRLKLDTENKNRFNETEECYEEIENTQEELGLEMTVLSAYASFLAEQNKHNAAIEKYTQELAMWRKLAETNSEAYLPDLADTLNNIAFLQAETNCHKEAECNYTEALGIYRNLAGTNPGAYLSDIALIMVNLANLQSKTNRHTEAECNYIEALGIYRNMAETNPDAYLPDLTMTLNNLAMLQTNTNRHKEAEANYAEALGIYKNLAETNPDAYLPDLAMMLNNLAMLQTNTNCHKEAEANYAEALGIYRNLAETNPDAYLPDLAMMLGNLGVLQMNTNRHKEAERNFAEALGIYRNLARTNPDAYLPDLARALNNLAFLQMNTNRHKEAEANYTEALGIYKNLAGTDPDAYFPNLALMLHNLAMLQTNTNNHKEAEANYAEALGIYKNLAETNPDAYFPNLALMLNNLALMQTNTNRHKEAEANYTEALGIYKNLAETNPDAYFPNLALILNNLALLQTNTNRNKEAEANYTEALGIYRTWRKPIRARICRILH